MEAAEGVIKFDLDYQSGPALAPSAIAVLNSWRRILFLLQLIGQDRQRYGGLGYGNLSQRLAPDAAGDTAGFVISGTQTGGLPLLLAQHYTRVLACDTARNRVVARGPAKPSSECLTHATLYDLDAGIQCVMHVHSPEIWRHAHALALPLTDPEVAYGTPQMAYEVQRIYPRAAQRGVFVMAGHKDGVVAVGSSVAQAGHRLVDSLADALAKNAE